MKLIVVLCKVLPQRQFVGVCAWSRHGEFVGSALVYQLRLFSQVQYRVYDFIRSMLNWSMLLAAKKYLTAEKRALLLAVKYSLPELSDLLQMLKTHPFELEKPPLNNLIFHDMS